jgi:hypothetical protein
MTQRGTPAGYKGAPPLITYRPLITRPRPKRHRRRILRLARTIVVVVLLVLLAVPLLSFGRAMSAPSSLPLPIRAIEWLRENGGAGIVDTAERVYYTATAPKTGGPNPKALPSVGDGTASLVTSGTGPDAPPRISLAVGSPMPGEGVWRAARATTSGPEPVLVTVFRPEASYPRQLAYVAWIDTSRTRLKLYPGRVEPPDAHPRGPMKVPQQMRRQLLATFNSGFTYKDGHGGFAINGVTMEPMVPGDGAIVGYADGTVDVLTWLEGRDVPTGTVLARQNLPLIVDAGRPNPELTDKSKWGKTLGTNVRVWRSAIGVDVHRNLIYLAAPGQTAASLGSAMIRAGAVRAMQLDINQFWPSFITYGGPGAARPHKLVPNTQQRATRYLRPDDRDFFAVYQR